MFDAILKNSGPEIVEHFKSLPENQRRSDEEIQGLIDTLIMPNVAWLDYREYGDYPEKGRRPLAICKFCEITRDALPISDHLYNPSLAEMAGLA